MLVVRQEVHAKVVEQLTELRAELAEARAHIAFLRDALGQERQSVWRDVKLSASTAEAVEAVNEWQAELREARARLAEAEAKARLARLDALEEAAVIAEDEDGHFTWAGMYSNARMLQQCAMEIAAAIRSLAARERQL